MKSRLLLLLIPISLLACSGKKLVKQEEITAAISKTMCHKMLECQPQSMPNEEYCSTMMQSTLAGAFKNFKIKDVTQSNLDKCVDTINKSTCEGLQAKEPPEECDFLKPL